MVHLASGREWRGGQRQVYLLARGLAALPDVETLVVTGRDTALAERCHAAGIKTHDVQWTMGLDPRAAAGLLREIHPGTIVHAHDSHAHTLADAVSRLKPVPVIVARRVILPIRNPGRYRRAAAVIAVSEAVRIRVVEAGVDATRVRVVPDAIDLDTLPVAALSPQPSAGTLAPNNAPIIVCIAALTPEKGIDVLLDAAADLRATHPAVRWIVLGEGKDRKRLEHRRAKLGLSDVVLFPGAVSTPEEVLAQATIAVQPSTSEGFGSSVLDALALGVPVVASTAGGLPETLAAGGGVLVPPGKPRELAHAVRQLLDQPEERARLGTEGRIAVKQFGVDRLVAGTLDVYRSIAQT